MYVNVINLFFFVNLYTYKLNPNYIQIVSGHPVLLVSKTHKRSFRLISVRSTKLFYVCRDHSKTITNDVICE